MSEEKLIYDSDGTYRIGESLAHMDVVKNAGKSKAADAQPRPPRRAASPKASTSSTAKKTAKASGGVAPAQTASKGFDLNAYRKQAKAAKGASAEEPKSLETPKASAKRATKAATAATSAPAPVAPVPTSTSDIVSPVPLPSQAEAEVLPTPTPAVEIPPEAMKVEGSAFEFRRTDPLKERESTPEKEVGETERRGISAMDLSHIKESAVREDKGEKVQEGAASSAVDPTPTDEDFALEKATAEALGDYADQAADEAVAQEVEANLIEELTSSAQSIKPEPPAEFQAFEESTQAEWKTLAQADRKEEEGGATPPSAVVSEEPKLEGVRQADDNVDQGHFDVVPAGELLANGSDIRETPQYIKDWLYRVINAKVRNPTAVFDCKDLAGLRAYYILQDSGRNPDILVAIGCGNRVSAVAVNSVKTSLADIASRISIQGALALIDDGVAAIYGQRNERTITL